MFFKGRAPPFFLSIGAKLNISIMICHLSVWSFRTSKELICAIYCCGAENTQWLGQQA